MRYVLDTVKGQAQAGKVKREGGAVFKALADGYMLVAYDKAQERQKLSETKPRPKPGNTPARAAQLRKINSELEDAYNSLRFVQTTDSYTEEVRSKAMQEVQSRIAQFERQRQQLTA